jgi:hypothetical protein
MQPAALWNLHDPQAEPPLPDASEIIVEADGGNSVHVDEATGAVEVTNPDGSVEVNLNPDADKDDKDESDFYGNLADEIDDIELGIIAQDLLQGIEADDQSRAEWLATRARGMDLLGLKIEVPNGDAGSSSAPVEGMSVVRHPLLLEAVLMAQANARAELLPADGPVKVSNDGEATGANEDLGEALEKDLNYYLTKKATEYYPDTDRMLLFTAFGGSGFKKAYKCPLRRRPVSESVDAADLIVDNTATDFRNAARVTHKITMRKSVLKRMMKADVYRTLDLTAPTPKLNAVERKEGEVQGVSVDVTRPEDQPYTIYECYCELELDEYAPDEFKGKGIALPFKVSIDKDSQEILEVRRNWEEEDEDCLPDVCFVQYPYIRGFGFYGIGLLHILGNSTQALTAAWREMLDAGMFANFPGFLIAKMATRQQTNEFRVAPGSGVPIDTSGMPIKEAVMELPYKDVSPGLLGLVDKITTAAQRVGGAAEIKVGEGRQDAPVGTTIALIEQATKIESAVHKNLHQAQGEEFQMLAKLFRDDPESMWRGNKRPATQWTKDKFLKALDTFGIEPQADANTPSHIHRVMKAVGLKQVAMQNPGLYNMKEVDSRVIKVMGWDDIDALFAPPAPPQGAAPDPALIKTQADAAAKQADNQTKQAVEAAKLQDNEKERANKLEIEGIKLATTLAIHPTSEGVADNTVRQFETPTA